MPRRLLPLAALLLAGAALAPPAASGARRVQPPRLRVATDRAALGRGTRTADAPAAEPVRLGIVVARPDPQGELAQLARLYDTASPDYHRFLTPQQFATRFGVRPDAAAAVRAWLRGAGMRVAYASRAGDYLVASGTVAGAERLAGTSLGSYRLGGERFTAPDRPARIPADLPVLSVLGLDTSRRFHTMGGTGAPRAPSLGARSARELWSIYEQPADQIGAGVSVGILGEGQTDSVIEDLHTFDDRNELPRVPVDVVHTPAGGDFSDKSGNPEWNIDMQAIHGMAPGIAREVLYFGPSLRDTDLVASEATWVSDPNGPPILNASLGECEVTPANTFLTQPALDPINGNESPSPLPVSQGLSNSSEPAQTMLLEQAVIEGRTLFSSSGDSGSSCTVVYPGTNGVGNYALPLTEGAANNPFGVGVGGTVLYSDGMDPAHRAAEYAWTHSGGNASPFITAPLFQHDVPNLNRVCVSDPSGAPTNTGQLCRGVPDVAALSGDVISNGYKIVSDGSNSIGGGTSLSSPLWAGMWARVAGTAPPGSTGYGFANDAFYKIGKDMTLDRSAFFDITVGDNGFNPALPGWDYVTGWGVPRVTGLIAAVKKVAPPVFPTVGAGGRPLPACIARTGLGRLTAKRRGRRGLTIRASGARTGALTADVFQSATTSRVVRGRRVARLSGKGGVLRWSGRARRGRHVHDGYLFARVRRREADGFRDTGRVALRRSHGRLARRPDFFAARSCTLLRKFKLSGPAFGGSSRHTLGVSYSLGSDRTRVSLTIKRGKRTVRRVRARVRSFGRTYRLHLPARGLPAGDYRVRITAVRGSVRVTRTLVSHRI